MPIPSHPSFAYYAAQQRQWRSHKCYATATCNYFNIIYTSGTTGKPKGCPFTNRNIITNAINGLNCFSKGIGKRIEDLRQMITVPLFHVTGSHTQMNMALMGATSVVLLEFKAAECIDAMIEEKINFFVGVTAMLLLMRVQPNYPKLVELGLLEGMGQGGSPLPPDLGEAVLEDFPKMRFINVFGLTETTSIAAASFLPPDEIIERGSAVGVPIGPTKYKIVDEQLHEVPEGQPGELVISGAGVCKEYWNAPEKTKEAFFTGEEGRRWLRTGDIAVVDDKGLYNIVGRLKDMIVRGGENVYCVELENLVFMDYRVSQAGVAGVPDEVLGEKIKAVIFPKPEQTVTADEIKDYCRERIAEYKVPDYVVITDRPLPVNPGGKLIKPELKKM